MATQEICFSHICRILKIDIEGSSCVSLFQGQRWRAFVRTYFLNSSYADEYLICGLGNSIESCCVVTKCFLCVSCAVQSAMVTSLHGELALRSEFVLWIQQRNAVVEHTDPSPTAASVIRPIGSCHNLPSPFRFCWGNLSTNVVIIVDYCMTSNSLDAIARDVWWGERPEKTHEENQTDMATQSTAKDLTLQPLLCAQLSHAKTHYIPLTRISVHPTHSPNLRARVTLLIRPLVLALRLLISLDGDSLLSEWALNNMKN